MLQSVSKDLRLYVPCIKIHERSKDFMEQNHGVKFAGTDPGRSAAPHIDTRCKHLRKKEGVVGPVYAGLFQDLFRFVILPRLITQQHTKGEVPVPVALLQFFCHGIPSMSPAFPLQCIRDLEKTPEI